jgi:catechol 2,3-dioxygenase-like lactoylglutathione lyase family enzyme
MENLMVENKFSINGDHVMLTNYPVNPRIRAYGKARIDLATRLNNAADWDEHWKPASNPFPLTWGESWKHCIEYRVDDFAAEVGFFIDVLGFSVNALDHSYAMFTSPQQDFFFAFVPTAANEAPTSPDAFRLQFMVRDVTSTYQELLRRGIAFELTPQPLCPASSIQITSFRTPNGIPVEIWGIAMENSISLPEMKLAKNLQDLVNSDQKDGQSADEHEDAEELDDEYEDDELDDGKYDESEEEEKDDDNVGDVDLDDESDENEDMDAPGEEDEEEDDEEDLDEEEDNDESDEDEYDEEEDDDEEYDEDDYEIDGDEDDDYDDDDKDEYSSSTNHDPKKSHEKNSFPEAKFMKSNSFTKPAGSQQTPLLEYVDLESA